ncbi:MAG TPA: SH3 domain-containing protein [Stellaceae bacterium]|nr:SH3 domain-containing protein [Stellaceae bacterium]
MGRAGFGRILAVLWLTSAQAAIAAEDAKPVLPVPRFVSMRHGEVNLRVGPGTRYPVAWVFVRQNLPVEITQEFENWRKIRDSEGTEGWVHEASLQGRRYIVVEGAIRAVRADPAADANLVARAEPGVIGRLEKCPAESMDWCRVEVGGIRGWLRRTEMWGVYPQEIYPAP